MSLSLKFGADVLGVIESLSLLRTGPEPAEAWHVELLIEANTPETLEQALASVRAAVGTTGDLALLHGGTEVRNLAAAGCRQGPRLESVREAESQPGAAYNRRRLVLEFRAAPQTVAAVQSHRLTMRLATRAGEAPRLLGTGRAVLHSGEDPAAHEATLIAAPPSGFRRIRLATHRDAAGPTLEYETEDEQVFTALPGGVEDGHYVITESTTPDGRALRTITGFFVGVAARARALELRPAEDTLGASRLSQNPFTRRVDFEFSQLLEPPGAVALTESLSFTTTRRVIDHALLDSTLPAYRQQIGAHQTEVVQEGSAVGAGRHPGPPAPRYPVDLIERRVQYSLPHPGLPAESRWVTTWRYVSRSRAPIFATSPEA